MPNPDGTPTFDELINGDPTDTAGGGTAPPNPIGVPAAVYNPNTGQYEPWGAQTSTTTEHRQAGRGPDGTNARWNETSYGYQPPRYYGGDELAPAGWAPERIADLQRSMAAAGLIPKSASYRNGYWDLTSQKAFELLLGYANQTGTQWDDALNQYSQSGQTGDPGGRAPLTIRTSNPDDLRRVFRKAIIDELGQGWDQGKIDQMVSSYQASEASAQQQAYDMADTGGTVVQPPDMTTFAVTQARAEDPLGAQEHDALGFFDQFRQLVGGWQG